MITIQHEELFRCFRLWILITHEQQENGGSLVSRAAPFDVLASSSKTINWRLQWMADFRRVRHIIRFGPSKWYLADTEATN